MSLDGAVNTRKPRVMLATTLRLPSTARIAMALAASGCEVVAVTPPNHPLRQAHVALAMLRYPALRPIAALEAMLGKLRPDLVIPCDEVAVSHLHQLHRSTASPTTEALIAKSLGDPASFRLAESRLDFLQAAREAGARTPPTTALRTLKDLQVWETHMPLPWVMKADGSQAGQGVRIVLSLQEAKDAFAEMQRRVSGKQALARLLIDGEAFWLRRWRQGSLPRLSVQGHIEGRPANCSVFCWNGEVVAGIAAEVVVAESQTGPSTVARVVDGHEMMQAVRLVVRRLMLSGLVGFDFMIETATGAAHMIEMNPRNTPICHINLGRGRNLPEALVAKLTGQPERSLPAATTNDIIAFFPDALQQDPSSEFLLSAFHDVPWQGPELVRTLLQPGFRDRYRLSRRLRDVKGHKKSASVTFGAALGPKHGQCEQTSVAGRGMPEQANAA